MAVTAIPGAVADDAEMVKIAEDELEKLQKQYRIMEVDKNNVVTNAQPTLRMQRNLLRILEKELEKIVDEIQLCRNSSNSTEYSKLKIKMNALNKDYEEYSSQVIKERKEISEIAYLIKQVEKEMFDLKSSVGSKDNSNDDSSFHMISQLENRLDNIAKRYNKCVADNKEVRNDIDRMLLDRKSFNVQWADGIKQLMEGKTKILEMVEKAITTYDQREEWCSKLEALKEKAAEDYRKHCLEVRDLQRQLDSSLKLEDFLKTKTKERPVLEDDKVDAKKLKKEEAERKAYAENCAIVEAAKETMGMDSVENIVEEYERLEDETFTLFTFINDKNMEMSTLNEKIKELNSSLEEEQKKHKERMDKQKDSVETLHEILEDRIASTLESKEELENAKKVLETANKEIDEFTSIADCHSIPIIMLYGDELRVTEFSVDLFLECLKHRVKDVVNLLCAFEEVKKQELLDLEKTPPPSTRRKSNRSSARKESKSSKTRQVATSSKTGGKSNSLKVK